MQAPHCYCVTLILPTLPPWCPHCTLAHCIVPSCTQMLATLCHRIVPCCTLAWLHFSECQPAIVPSSEHGSYFYTAPAAMGRLHWMGTQSSLDLCHIVAYDVTVTSYGSVNEQQYETSVTLHSKELGKALQTEPQWTLGPWQAYLSGTTRGQVQRGY